MLEAVKYFSNFYRHLNAVSDQQHIIRQIDTQSLW